MRRASGLAMASLAAAAVAAPASAREAGLVVFALRDGRYEAPSTAGETARPVGSLTKPFVARAWARTHPGAATPHLRCDAAAGCWRPSGHGDVGLARAVAVSCNAYFRALADDAGEATLAATLRAAGFRVPEPLSADGAIGLPTGAGFVAATPRAVLEAYVALAREPWNEGEAVRLEVLAGLRDGAREGTAAGLGALGLLAKTGTVPALDGAALATSGWAVAIDPAGRAFLGLLPRGTGREAARALAARLGGRPARPADAAGGKPREPAPSGRVRVALFAALGPRRVVARNASPVPLAGASGFVGPGRDLELRPGERLAEGDWELSLPAVGLRRLVRGGLRVDAGRGDSLRLRADVRPAEYVAGVLAAELPDDEEELRLPLGAAILRFLAAGPRHGDADVCDLTHCAWFVGRGPRASWPSPARAVLLAPPGEADAGRPIDPATFDRLARLARSPGPDRFTGHCGGEPLSPARLWGGSDRAVVPCPRHGPGSDARWSRSWPARDVDRAFGVRVRDLRVEDDASGRWSLRVATAEADRLLPWDAAHARLAAVLGWDALPSPADRVARDGSGFRASGRGRGHRVGLCLGARASGALLD